MNKFIIETISHLKEVFKKPKPSENRFGYREAVFFLQFIRPLWKLSLMSLVLTIVYALLSSMLPLSGKVLIDFVVMKKGFEKIDNLLLSLNLENFIPYARHFLESANLVLLAALFVGIITGLIGLIQRYIVFRLQQELTFNLQTKLFDHVLRFPITFFRKSQVGYIASRVSDDVNSLQFLFSHIVSLMLPKMFYLFFGISIIFLLSVKLSLIMLCIFPVYIFINYYFGRRLRRSSMDEYESTAQVSKDIQEVLSGVETIKTFTAEKRESRKVSERLTSLIDKKIKRMLASLLSDYSARGSQFLTTLLIMWLGINEILKGSMSIGDYVAFISYVVYLSGSINTISRFHIILQPFFASLERLSEIFGIVPEFKEKDLFLKPKEGAGEIMFKNVSFYYEEGKPVLKDISFTSRAGEITALVGPSGAGKTTIVNLILKFFKPQSGHILLNGHDINEIDTSWLREHTGIVSQETFLFNDTIANNIRYGNPLAGLEEVISAAKKAGIHEDIESFPEKYDTITGERGMQLSAGQRQRISIARAILKNPAILIFDEPASALDSVSEKILIDSIRGLSGGRIIFVIAHRFSTIEIADRVLTLENSRIIETVRPI